MIAIDAIYDAAFDRSRFPALVEQLCRAFGAQSGFIAWSDDREAGFQAQYGGDPVWLQRYVETYAPHDILRPHLMTLGEGECSPAWPLLQRDDIRESLFYRDYLAPQTIVDNLAVNLIKRPGITAHLALIRQGDVEPFTPEECAGLSALTTHLRRAIFIQSQIVRAADRGEADQGALSSALLLSGERQVLEIDPPLLHLLGLHMGDMIRDGRIAGAIDKAVTSGEPVAILLEDEGRDDIPLLLEARRLEPDRFGDLAAGPGAVQAIHVTRLDRPRIIAFDAMASLYRLTATELRVLRDALEQSDLTGIGERLGMARATTRTHLHRIYEKTGTHGFAGLSNLAHRFVRIRRE